jgi:hypothetical protein
MDGFPPRQKDEICHCCGADFGYDDETLAATRKYREEWINKGAIWFCSDEKPENWSLEEQLKNIPEEFQ